MKLRMRQTRDGAVEFIDGRPGPVASPSLKNLSAWWRWRPALVWYMRTLAWVWIAKGLFGWSIILGAYPPLGDFTAMRTSMQGAIAAFACLDLLAAVGLWLAASWGGVLWLLCASVEAVLPLFGPGAATIGRGGALINFALIAGYGLIAWRARQERG
jgi:fatty acid desaturase